MELEKGPMVTFASQELKIKPQQKSCIQKIVLLGEKI